MNRVPAEPDGWIVELWIERVRMLDDIRAASPLGRLWK